jgi:hypothetical protein
VEEVERREVDRRLSVHEAVCAERYAVFISRVDRLEKVMLICAGSLVVGMAGLIARLMFH